MEPFEVKIELKESIIPKDSKFNCMSKKQWFIIIIILSIIVLGLSIFLIVFLTSSGEEKEKELPRSEILCLYRINDVSKEIPLLNEEYNKNGYKWNNSKLY